MKKLTALFVVVFAVAFSSNVFAQNSDSKTGTATAKIISKITLASGTPLNFGTIAQTTSTGTVTLSSTSDEATYNNNSSIIQTSTESRATFNVTGQADALYTIALPSSATLTRVSGTETMTVNGFVTDNSLTASQISSTGADSFHVGAVLNFGANQVAGVYNGTYTVTVTYN